MQTKQHSQAAEALIFAIDVYRNSLSHFMLHSCRMYPTCSEYARKSIQAYGAIRGSIKAAYRLCRCHPFSNTLVDAVR